VTNVATRLLTLIFLLQSRGNWKAAELAERLNVSERTIHRYFDMLDEIGIPIYTERGPYGGFSIMRGYKLPPLIFSTEEASVLYLGASLIKDILGQTFEEAVTSATAKLDNVLPLDIQQEIEHIRRTLIIDGISYRRSDKTQKILHIVRQSLQAKKSLLIQYKSRSKHETQRRLIDPYGLSLQWGMWYLGAFCHLRNELRTFRVERIQSAELTDRTYDIPEDFSIRQYLHNMQYEPQIEIELEFDPAIIEMIKEQYGGWMEFNELPNGFTQAKFMVYGLEWVSRFVINLGQNVRIITPQELIDRTIINASAILEIYT
jgi:predicted DNA-binding transcriptional regulator YafY